MQNDNIYKLKRKWYGFIQHYNLSNYSSQLFSLLGLIIVVWLAASSLIALNEYFFGAPLVKGETYLKFYNLILKTILSPDLEAFEGYTTFTLVLSILMVVVGLIIIGLFTGQIISMLIYVIEKSSYFPEKPAKFCFKNPILICGINSKLQNIIIELKKSKNLENREIIIIDNLADTIVNSNKKLFQNVYFLKGNAADKKILEIALGSYSKKRSKRKFSQNGSAIILSDSNENKLKYVDYKSIEVGLAIEGFNQKINTIVEINNIENKFYFENTKIDEIISVSEYGIKLLSQAALNNGITNVYKEILIKDYEDDNISDDLNSIFITKLSEIGIREHSSYNELKEKILINNKNPVSMIGFEKYIDDNLRQLFDDQGDEKLISKINKNSYISQVNPSKKCDFKIGNVGIYKNSNSYLFSAETILGKDDKVIYISTNKLKFRN